MLRKVEHKLKVTRRKVSKRWKKYRKVKKHVLHLHRLSASEKQAVIASEYDLTRQSISNIYTDYCETKHSLLHRSPYSDFMHVKNLVGMHKELYTIDRKSGKHIPKVDHTTGKTEVGFFRFRNTSQKIYKAKRNFNPERLDKIIPEILSDQKVQGVLIVYEIVSEETDQKSYVSNYMTLEQLKRNQSLGETVNEYISKKFQAGSTKDFKLKFIYMRIIYKKR
jgi:hypothetical protein